MATEWYYTKDGTKHGPVSARRLKDLASRGELAVDDLVWRENLKDWMPAAKVEGLSFGNVMGPPPLPNEPPLLPGRAGGADRFQQLAIWHRRLNGTMLAAIILSFVVPAVASAFDGGSTGRTGAGQSVFEAIILLSLAVFQTVFAVEVYHVAKLVDWNPVLAVVTVLIPYVCLIPLFVISRRANKALKGAGFEVGFLGAKPRP